MKLPYYLLPLLAWMPVNSPLMAAQDTQPATVYHVVDHMKVAPGMNSEYLELEAAWKKIHTARKEAGVLDQWELTRVVSPSGADVEYNYVTRNTYVGDEKLAAALERPMLPENWMSLLTADEVALVMRTTEIRTLVKTEVWAEAEAILAEDMSDATIQVVNFFALPEGKTRADHFSTEREIWMPVHQARVKQGQMKGWVLGFLVLPFGSEIPYQDVTVDIYRDMKEMLGVSYPEYFQAVHPDKDIAELFAQTQANADLVRGEVRMPVDGVY